VIDLHCHSVCSDGSETPRRVVELAAEAGCAAVALTDHDGLDGLAVAGARAAELGIGFVPGCEVSCAADSGSLHLLCYFIETGDSPLASELVALRADREQRNERLLERLAELGMPISPAELAEEAGGGLVGRPHVAALLVRHGFASSVDDAFTSLIGQGAPGYVSKARLSPLDAVGLVAASGGESAVAHPLTLGLDPSGLERMLAELAEAGLGGLECYYGRYDDETRSELVALARALRLVPTGGSDFHGRYKPDLSVGTGTGDLLVPDEVLVELASRRPGRPAPL
jgi:predicted metal-dependent phosphoesterase TrpH